MTQALTTVLLALALLLTGCSGGADPVLPEESTSAGQTPGSETGPEQRFGLDDTAQFDDGLEVEIAGSFAGPLEEGDTGAESTGGEVVTASVRIENGTTEPYDPRNATVTATYGEGAGTAAPPVTGAAELTGTFTEVIAVADEGVTAAGFTVPAAELGRVSFLVDLHDDSHDPMIFTGRVVRAEPVR